ncbi:MAG TPA: PAS domain S-box protein [Gammaproteobacteria bacterium]
MPETPETRTQVKLLRSESWYIAAAAIVAVLTLVIWATPLAGLLPPAWLLTRPLSAAGMLLAAATAWISLEPAPSWRRYGLFAGAGLLLVLGILGLTGQLPGGGTSMSPQSGFGFCLLGLLLPVNYAYRGPARMAADVLTLALALFVLVMLMGYLFASSAVFGDVSAIRIPFTSFACFFLFVTVMIMRRSRGGMLAVLSGDRIGSRIVRVAIPLALTLPLMLSLVRAYVVSTGLLSPAYASAVSISFICLCVTLLALLMGWRINRLEREIRDLLQHQADAKLEESEQRYTDLVEQSISGFMVRRPDGRLALVNEAYRKMTGYSREELMQLKARDLVVDQGVIERVQRLQAGESTHIETYLRRKDGSLLEVEYVTQKMRNGDLQSVLLDISHRKQLQKQRDESERRYAELVDQALEGIMVRRPNGDIVFVNETFCRLLGYSREELLSFNIRAIVHPEDRETIQQIEQLGHGGHLRLQKRMQRKDGATVHVEVSAKRLRNGDIQTTVQDLSARKQAENRYQTAVNALAEGVAMLDGEGRVVAFNKSATNILGLTEDQFTGRMVMDPTWQLQYEDGRPFDMDEHPVIITLKTGQDRDDVIFDVALPDGSRRTLTVSSRGLEPDKTGKPTSVLASFRDITVQRQQERALRNYAEELRHVSQRILEAQETERRAIARDLHDEVGQSLTATRINLRDLEVEAKDGPFAKRLTDASNIISELLGKVRQMSLDLHPSVLDDLGLGPALSWCVRTRTTGSNLQVTLDVPSELPRFADMAEITLFRIFQEALSNALRHSQAKHLQARIRHADGQLFMTVKDDGRGFDADAARRTALSGKSLGLLGMQERARLAGGELTLTSAPGRGTEVNVSLPAQER